jgi:hypothetical protein
LDGHTYFIQFHSPSTATYFNAALLTIVGNKTFSGTIGVAIYSNNTGLSPSYTNHGVPGVLEAFGTVRYTSDTNLDRRYIEFGFEGEGATLTANTLYWFAFANDHGGGTGALDLGRHVDYVSSNAHVLRQPATFTTAEGFQETISGLLLPTELTTTNAAVWFRLW